MSGAVLRVMIDDVTSHASLRLGVPVPVPSLCVPVCTVTRERERMLPTPTFEAIAICCVALRGHLRESACSAPLAVSNGRPAPGRTQSHSSVYRAPRSRAQGVRNL